MIRTYLAEDAPQLAAIHNRVYTKDTHDEGSFREMMADALDDGLAWVIGEPPLFGYAMVTPVPGLPGVGDLAGCIAPERQRQGLGSELLRFVLAALRGGDYRQIAHAVTDLDGPAASFLRAHEFFVEHEEWVMELNDLSGLPDGPDDARVRLQAYPRATAVPLFCRLYEESFSGLPWNQPFSQAEVAATLNDAGNMHFLMLNGEAVGFAWSAVHLDGKGVIEPLGILPAYQGQGYGRVLLQMVLRELASRGAKKVEIGAWRDNQAAIHLYESLGLRRRKTVTYLAFNLNQEAC